MIVAKRNSLNKVLYLSLTAAAVLLQTHNVHSETCTGTLTFNGSDKCGTNYIVAGSYFTQCSSG